MAMAGCQPWPYQAEGELSMGRWRQVGAAALHVADGPVGRIKRSPELVAMRIPRRDAGRTGPDGSTPSGGRLTRHVVDRLCAVRAGLLVGVAARGHVRALKGLAL
jgi:hypothetical protein